jgi:hypothetical protein
MQDFQVAKAFNQVQLSNDKYLMIDRIERKIFFDLMKSSIEFSKVDEIDRNVMAWMVIEAPTKVKSWLDYLASDYKRKKQIQIDPEKLMSEIQQAIFI